MKSSTRLFVVSILLFLSVSLAAAIDNAKLEQAIDAYWDADFEKSEAALDAVSAAELSRTDLVQWHQFRAMCAMAMGKTDKASRAFGDLLAVQPGFQMDPVEVAPPVVARFEEARYEALRLAYDSGKAAYTAGNYRAAATHFNTVLRIDPLNLHGRAFHRLALENAGNAE